MDPVHVWCNIPGGLHSTAYTTCRRHSTAQRSTGRLATKRVHCVCYAPGCTVVVDVAALVAANASILGTIHICMRRARLMLLHALAATTAVAVLCCSPTV